jgi:hypothetical protein
LISEFGKSTIGLRTNLLSHGYRQAANCSFYYGENVARGAVAKLRRETVVNTEVAKMQQISNNCGSLTRLTLAQ